MKSRPDPSHPSKAGAPRRRWPRIVVIALLGVLAVAAIAVPMLLDVERHRDRIERALREATGWEADLGEIDLSVLRGLALTVSPASLEAPAGGSRFEVRKIAVRAALMPLFRGRLEIESIDLLKPDITLVRRDAERGWILPQPLDPAAARDAVPPSAEEGPPAVSIDRIGVRDGALRLEDGTLDPPLVLAVEDVDVELRPVTGEIKGSGAFADDGGRISWSGSPDVGFELGLEDLNSGVVGPWVGDGVLHPGGRLAGQLSVALPEGVAGKVTATSLRVLAGSRPLPTTELEFRLSPDGAGWKVDRLTLAAGGAEVVGSGTLLPLSLQLDLPPTPLETALELSEALFPLGLDVSPPGSARLTARIDMSAGGELTYEAEGELSAARFVAAEILPEVTDVRAALELTRQGELILRILDGSVGNGPLEGTVRIDSIDPLGRLVFEGEVDGASFGQLLGGFVAEAPERLTGPAVVNGAIAVDLSAPALDASSIAGKLALGASDVSVAGWDLEGAFRETLRDKLGKLADVAALVDSDAGKALLDDASTGEDPARRLLDRVAADVSFDTLPWGLRSLRVRSGGVSASGQGSLDPVSGTLDLRLTAELDPELTGRYVGRYGQLRSLVNDRGNLSLPLQIHGPLVRPELDLELSGLLQKSLRGEDPEKAVKGLLEGLIDRKLLKEKKK
jgi:hypothetical protein